MIKRSYYIINGITSFRIIAAPILFYLIYIDQIHVFKWLLGVCFLTDAIDGYLARKFEVTSVFGSRLDSVGDDLTVIAGVAGLFVFRLDFIEHELLVLISLLALFFIQVVLSFARYGKISSFHTYFAKISAILQGVFLLLIFFFNQPLYTLFYVAAMVTAIDLLEEIILVMILPTWEANVKGLYWVLKKKDR